MAITLKDRKETINLGGNVYELTLLWNREDIRRCAFGMAPDYAHIRKDGKNFALQCIHAYRAMFKMAHGFRGHTIIFVKIASPVQPEFRIHLFYI